MNITQYQDFYKIVVIKITHLGEGLTYRSLEQQSGIIYSHTYNRLILDKK